MNDILNSLNSFLKYNCLKNLIRIRQEEIYVDFTVIHFNAVLFDCWLTKDPQV